MKKFSLINPVSYLVLLPVVFIISCAAPEQKAADSDYFFLDIRIDNNDKIHINNQITNPSYLNEFLAESGYPSKTRGRVIFTGDVPLSSVMSVSAALKNNFSSDAGPFTMVRYSRDKFESLGQEIFHVDIISENSLLFEGNLIHTEDLGTALESFMAAAQTENPVFNLTINEDLPVYLIHEIPQKLNGSVTIADM